MDEADRKAAIRAYKERDARAGVYSVRCAATGRVWVGRAANLDGIENQLRFTLRAGSHRCAALQAVWREGAGADLTFAVLEVLDPDLTDYVRRARLKDRLAYWTAQLGAEQL